MFIKHELNKSKLHRFKLFYYETFAREYARVKMVQGVLTPIFLSHLSHAKVSLSEKNHSNFKVYYPCYRTQ